MKTGTRARTRSQKDAVWVPWYLAVPRLSFDIVVSTRVNRAGCFALDESVTEKSFVWRHLRRELRYYRGSIHKGWSGGPCLYTDMQQLGGFGRWILIGYLLGPVLCSYLRYVFVEMYICIYIFFVGFSPFFVCSPGWRSFSWFWVDFSVFNIWWLHKSTMMVIVLCGCRNHRVWVLP